MADGNPIGASLRKEASAFPIDPSAASQQSARRARIWNIGELGGGVSYFGEDNLLGIYSLLKDRISQGQAPDVIVLRQVLPEVPVYGTKGYRARNLLVAEHVDDVDQSVVMMKPHLSRITELIKKSGANTRVVYIWGYNDEQNEKVEYEALTEAFNHNPQHLARMRMNYGEVVADLGSKIDNIDMEVPQRRKELEIIGRKMDSTPERERSKRGELAKSAIGLGRKIAHLEEKKEQLLGELADNLQIKDLYTKLLHMWMAGRDADEIFDTLGDEYVDGELSELIKFDDGHTLAERREVVRQEFDEVKRQLAKLDVKKDGKARLAQLETRAKELANALTKLSHSTLIAEKSNAERSTEERLARERRFTGLEAGKPSQTKIASQLSRMVVQSHIKDVFGRRMSISIAMDNLTHIEVNGLNIAVGTKGTNTSQQFVKDSSRNVGWVLRSLERDADMLLLSGSPRGMYEPLPKFNRSDGICFTDVAPPCVDVEKLREEHRFGRKTWFTEMLTKGVPASGFNEIVVEDGNASHTFFSAGMLQIFSDREKAMQAKVMAKLVSASYSFNRAQDPLDARDLLQLRHKLPSELTEKTKLAALLDDSGIDRKDERARTELTTRILEQNFSGAQAEQKGLMKWLDEKLHTSGTSPEFNRMTFLDLTDVHMGSPGEGYPNRMALDAMVKWTVEKVKEDIVLVLDGDNIEGNLGNFKNRVNRENDQHNEYAFGKFIAKKGIEKGSEEYAAQMKGYREWLYYKNPIPSLNTQADLFIEAIAPLIQSGKVKGIIVTDGNHANGTFPGGDVTESGELWQRIVAIAPEELKPNVKRVYGGRHGGYGEFEIGEGLGVSAGHRTEATTIEKLSPKGNLAVGGDRHRHRKTTMGERVVFEGMCLQGNSGFPDIIGIPTTDSLRGMSILTVDYGKGGSILAAKDSFVSISQLKREGRLRENPLILEFEAAQRAIEVKPERLKAY